MFIKSYCLQDVASATRFACSVWIHDMYSHVMMRICNSVYFFVKGMRKCVPYSLPVTLNSTDMT